jgi:hypothetical protein
VTTDNESARVTTEPRTEPLQDLTLARLVIIGEGEVPTEDEVEWPVGHGPSHITWLETDTFSMLSIQTEGISPWLERILEPFSGQLPETAFWEYGLTRSVEEMGVHVGCDDSNF